jgi:transcriptional regulator with XRE-family HTH domain
MVDMKLLRAVMKEKGYSTERLAEELGMNASTLYRKFNQDGATFTVAQVGEITRVLGIPRATAHAIYARTQEGREPHMVDMKLLRAVMKEKGYSTERLAEELGMNASTLYRKFNQDGATFTVAQVGEITRVLGIPRATAHAIFFNEQLA